MQVVQQSDAATFFYHFSFQLHRLHKCRKLVSHAITSTTLGHIRMFARTLRQLKNANKRKKLEKKMLNRIDSIFHFFFIFFPLFAVQIYVII